MSDDPLDYTPSLEELQQIANERGEKGPLDRVEGQDLYLATIDRLEPEITLIDRDVALASIAVSLKRIADTLDCLKVTIKKTIVKALEEHDGRAKNIARSQAEWW